MRIAIYHELPKGGARRAINEFSRALGKKNSVDLYVVDEVFKKNEKNFYHKIFLYKFIPKKWNGNQPFIRLYKDTIEVCKLYQLTKKIASVINSKNYDGVIVSASKYIEAPFIMRFLKGKFVFYCSDPNYRFIYEKILQPPKSLGFVRYSYEKLIRLIYKKLDQDNIRMATICLAPSTYIAELFTKTYKKKNYAIHYGVDTTFFHPGTTKKDIDIFYIGSYAPIDGLDLLDGAVKYMKSKPIVKKLIAEEEWISDDKVLRSLYQRSKVLFCPAHNEGLGASLMEAMSCGTPVVAVDEAGHKELVINDKNGYLIPRNAKAAASLLDSLLLDKKRLNKLSKFARLNMETNWTWSKRAGELEKILKQVKG